MKSIAKDLHITIDSWLSLLERWTENEALFDVSEKGKWTRKEIIGHLIDSAQNNIRRFIVAQYEDNPTILYEQDKWVSINNYNSYEQTDVVSLWYLLNKQIVAILKNMDEEVAQRTCQTQEPHTLEWLAIDYIAHLKHHMHEVLNLEPVAYP